MRLASVANDKCLYLSAPYSWIDRFALPFLILCFGLVAFSNALAIQATPFGPTNYTRQTGTPVEEIASFTVGNLNDNFTLTVYNGGLEDDAVLGEYVSSSIIKINDKVILGPENFNQNVSQLSVPVALLQENVISVELHGKPGGALTLEIVGEGNTPPIAVAGLDQTVYVGTQVQLDGSGSTDLDGDLLSYRWSIDTVPTGSLATLTNSTIVTPTFGVDLPGLYSISLVVNDGTEDSAPDNIEISTLNSVPIANAGNDQTVFVGNTVTLDGSASSDVDGDELSYQWLLTTRPDFSLAELGDIGIINPTFDVDRAGVYIAELTVNDGVINSDPDTVVVSTANSRPVADAGIAQDASVGEAVVLDASGSNDVDGDSLTYQWSLISVPNDSTAALTEMTTLQTTLIPDLKGTYVVQLIVSDGQADSDPDTITVTALNTPPIADAGMNQTVVHGTLVQLSGADSSDADGDPLTYQWMLIGSPTGSNASLSETTTQSPSIQTDLPGTYSVQLTVNDGFEDSATETVVITSTNTPPVANAGSDQTVGEGIIVQLNGNGSTDADGDSLTYRWSLTSAPLGSTAILSDPSLVNPTFIADSTGTYSIELVVNDGFIDSIAARIAVTSIPNQPPILDFIGNQTIPLGTTQTFNLTASDPNNDTLHFLAQPLPLIDGASLDSSSGQFIFKPDVSQIGEMTLTFIVTDGVLTDSETVTITVPTPDSAVNTNFSGRLLDANDFDQGITTPIVGSKISFLNTGQSTISGSDGYFTLTDLPTGNQVLDIDNSTASPAPDGSTYASFREQTTLQPNVTNIVERPFFLPRINAASLTPVDPNSTTVVSNSTLGISFTVPPHTAKNPDGTDFTGALSISLVPRSLSPVLLPDTLDPALLITIQPVGVTFATPVPITFPNSDNVAAGNELNLWSLDPDTGRFVIVGTGQVSADGQNVETIFGGVRAADWHAFLQLFANSLGTVAEKSSATQEPTQQHKTCVSSTVTSQTGCLNTGFNLPAYFSLGQSRSLSFVYKSERAHSVSVIPFDMTISRRAAVPPKVSYKINFGGIEQGNETFISTSGFNENVDESLRGVTAFNSSTLSTGIYPYSVRLTSNYGSSRISTDVAGVVTVVNDQQSPFGSGWGLAGLLRLQLSLDGQVLIVDGKGGSYRFRPGLNVGDYLSSAGDYSILTGNIDGTFTQTLKNGTQIQFNVEGLQTAVIDRNGNTTNYNYDSQQRLTTITDPVSLVTTLSYTGDHLNTVTDPAGRVSTFTHDLEGNLIQIAFPDSTIRTFGYDQQHLMTSETDARGLTSTRAYDTTGRFTSTLRPDGSSRTTSDAQTIGFVVLDSDQGTSVNPAPAVRPNTVQSTYTDGEGHTESYNTDQFGRLTRRTDANGLTTLIERGAGIVGVLQNGAQYATGKIGAAFDFPVLGSSVIINSPVANFGTQDFSMSFWVRTRNKGSLINKRISCNHHSFWDIRIGGAGNLSIELDQNSSATNYTAFSSNGSINDGQFHHVVVTRQGPTTSLYIDGAIDNSQTVANTTNVQNSAPLSIGTGACVNSDGTVAFLGQLDELEFYERALSELDVATLFTNENTGFQGFLSGIVSHWSANQIATDSLQAIGLPTKTTRPDGSTITRSFDGRGNLLKRIEQFNGASTTYTYDSTFNQITSITDSKNKTTFLERDNNGNLAKLTNALGQITTFAYNEQGLLTETTDQNNLVTTFTYNLQGLPETIKETPPTGGGVVRTTTMFYDTAGLLTQTLTPEGITLTLAYDQLGRLINITNNLGQKFVFDYDTEGNLIQTDVIDPNDLLITTVTQTFDNLNRLLTVTTPHLPGTDSTTHFQYDQTGNLIDQTDPNNNTSSRQYDPGNRLTEVIDALNGRTLLTYDSNNNINQVTAPNGAVTQSSYDSLSRLITEISPDRGIVAKTFDLNNNLATVTDARGITSTLVYDSLNRITSIVYPDTSENITLSYDNCPLGIGRLCSRTDQSGTYDYSYDAYGNVIQVDYTYNGVTFTTQYQYDAGHRITLMTLPSGRTINYQRDGLSRIEAIQSELNGINNTVVNNITYQADRNVTARLFANNIAEARTYDQQGRLKDTTLGSLDQILYSYDANGNLLSRNTQGANHDYLYDPLDRLSNETNNGASQDYTYDPNNNRLTEDNAGLITQYDYLAASNKLTSIDASALTYDVAGNLTSNGQGRTYTYNNVGRLHQVFDNAILLTTYIYNNQGLRKLKINPQGSILYHYDLSGTLISETQVDGTPIRDYIWHQSTPIAQIDGDTLTTDTITYLHADHLNTPRLGTNNAGTVIWRWESQAFGNSSPDQIGGVVINLRFPGQYFDSETGLHYNYFRYYDPQTGRYITSDPIGLQGGLNTYTYVGGNPLSYSDPQGLFVWDLLDYLLFLQSLYEYEQCQNFDTAFNLGLDTIGLLPVIPALSILNRFDDALDSTKSATKSVDDLIKDSKPGGKTKGRTSQFDRSGGFDQANKDFDALDPKGVKDIDTQFGPGRRGTLPDGRSVNVRPGSSNNGPPTLEIQQGKNRLKFRFGE